MMVTFVSQCEKKALNRTRRVLDAFADRIGDNTWQTVITQEGLLAVKKLLRKTATKNTAVSCHWIRSRSRSDLVWVVGKRDKFNSRGVVPVNTTTKSIVKQHIENDWHYLPLIKSLVAMSALLHDWGKASQLFQEKLQPNQNKQFKGDPIRHEWVSCILLHAFCESCKKDDENKTDTNWLQALANGDIKEIKVKELASKSDKKPLSKLPPVAKLVAWLIVSHHRLPILQGNAANLLRTEKCPSIDDVLDKVTCEWGYQNKFDEDEYDKRVNACFTFPNGLLSNSSPWLNQIKKWSQRLLAFEATAIESLNDGSYRSVLTYSRLCLILGDHNFSSKEASKQWQGDSNLFANTDHKTKLLKQKLDEHLVGVACKAIQNAYLLPLFETEPPFAFDIKKLNQKSDGIYRWQEKAVKAVKEWQASKPDKHGFFAVNMASTGCGKTIANAKIMQALSIDGESLRFVLALGLRALTLQTGDEYRENVGLDSSELAVLIGSKAVMELHKKINNQDQEADWESNGSESLETLLDESIDYECAIPETNLSPVLDTQKSKNFLYAPVLACTIDHLMAATETKRGGRFILPTLRLMSSDLVIDEVDDFNGADLIAIGRLIHLAGMLGRKVMISSATITPDLAEGLFKAYRDGWLLYCKNRKAQPNIGCAWIDEFATQITNNSGAKLSDAIPTYRQDHDEFIQERVSKLISQPVKRKADISCVQHILANDDPNQFYDDKLATSQEAYFKVVLDSIYTKHASYHTLDPKTGLAVSYGVVRMANISPCVDLTKYLLAVDLPEDTQIRTMAYHSQQTLLLRHAQEKHLDRVLKRKELAGQPALAFSNAHIRKHLDSIKTQQPTANNVIFILVTTPVEEVGRDHDFDWAVIEPSSYRSIIQLAGRVRRHRQTTEDIAEPNISLLQYNLRAIKNIKTNNTNGKAFINPGFENYRSLVSHDLCQLVGAQQLHQRLDAIPRIQKPPNIDSMARQHNNKISQLVDLEHVVIKNLLSTYNHINKQGQDLTGPESLQGYISQAWYLTALPQVINPFRQSTPSTNIFLVYDEDKQDYVFCVKSPQNGYIPSELILHITHTTIIEEHTQRLWLVRSFDGEVMAELAEQQDSSVVRISKRYGELNFLHSDSEKYEYNDQFGLVNYREGNYDRRKIKRI